MVKKGDKHNTHVYRSSIEKEIKKYITILETYKIPELKLELIDDEVKQRRIRSIDKGIYFEKFLLLKKNDDEINEINKEILSIKTEIYMDYINNIIINYTRIESIIKEILVYDYSKMNYSELCFYRDNLTNFIKYYDKAINYYIAKYKKESKIKINTEKELQIKSLEFLKRFFEKFPNYKSDYISILNENLSEITKPSDYEIYGYGYRPEYYSDFIIRNILDYLYDRFTKSEKIPEQNIIDFKDSLCYLEGKFSFERERSYFI